MLMRSRGFTVIILRTRFFASTERADRAVAKCHVQAGICKQRRRRKLCLWWSALRQALPCGFETGLSQIKCLCDALRHRFMDVLVR